MKKVFTINWKRNIGTAFGIGVTFVLSFVVGVGLVWAINTAASGWRVDNGNTKEVHWPSSGANCNKVTNNSGHDLFVPTKTTGEWNAFSANKPSGVSIATCQICTPGTWDGNLGYLSTCSRTCHGSPWGPGETLCTYMKCNTSGTAYVATPCKCGGTCTAPDCSGGVCQHNGFYNNCPTNPGCS